MVSLYETQTGVVLAQQAVPDKGNAITVEAVLLTPTQVAGRIVTADAMHTQRTCCADIHRFGGYYVLFAKANQPTDGGRICGSSGAEPPPDCRDWRQARTWSKGHGRLELRELVASTELNEWLAAAWPGVEQVFRLQRTSIRQGQRHTQTIYGITSLAPTRASAARLLKLVRRHGRMENRLRLSPGCDVGRRPVSGAQRDGSAGPGSPQQWDLSSLRFASGLPTSPDRCVIWMLNPHEPSGSYWGPW